MQASHASVNTCIPSLDTIKLSVVYTGEIKKVSEGEVADPSVDC